MKAASISGLALALLAFGTALFAQQMPQTLYYKFNEGTGTTTANEGNPGQGQNPANMGTTAPPAWIAPGKLGNSNISLVGDKQGFITGWSPNLTTTTPWTIETWLRKNNGTQSYLCGAGTATSANFRIYQISGGVGFASLGGTLTATTFTTFTGWGNNSWNHLAAVYDPTVPNFRVYVNGVLDFTLNGTTNIVETTFTLGGRFPTDTLEWSGDIDDFRFWGVARTQAEIQANMNAELVSGPQLTASAVVGTQQVLANNAQGVGNNGLAAAVFTIASGAMASAADPALTSISIQAAGTGADQTDFSHVSVWRDANSTNAFEAGADTLIGTAAAAFPANDGTLTFNVQAAQQLFSASEVRRYFVVVKLAGTAAPNSTFTFRVSDITTAASTFKSGVPSAIMSGIRTLNPTLTAAAVAGTAQNVFSSETGGGVGFAAANFTIAANSEGTPTLAAILLGSIGTGNDATAYSEVAIYRESGVTAGYQAGDILIAANPAFSANDGTANFAVPAPEQAIPVGTTRTYYVVVKLNSTAAPGHTFNYIVNSLTPAAGSTSTGTPSVTINGLVISTPVFTYTDASALTAQTAYVASQGNVCQEFTVAYPGGPADKPTAITVTGLGTGHEVSHLGNVALWQDANASGSFESGNDTLVDNGAYALDNGTVVFDLAGHPNFTAGTTRTYFVVYDLTLTAVHNQTFKCYVSAATGMSLGGTNAGLPCPNVTGTAGLLVNATMLTATFNGPGAALTVQNNSSGITGSGELLLDFTLSAASGQPWPLVDITFAAAGTAAHDTVYQELGLYQDTGNGIWDGSLNDGAAAGTMTGFGAGPGFQATFTLSNGMVGSGQSRRFFLVGKLNGTATTGQTLNARLESVTGNLPMGGVQVGFPSLASTALIIDQSVLTVAGAPGAPGNQLHEAGTSLSFVMAKFRLSASNDTVSVSGITFTGTGNGNWVTAMDAATGIQVYRDNGDGLFDSATDTLLYQGAGSASMNAIFTPSLNVPTRGSQEIWVRANLLATAGVGSATQVSYTVSVVQNTDVAASANVLLGTPAPNGAILNVVDFFVTTVDPLSDAPAGGKPLTITGSGFMAPFTMTIGGVVCPGTPTITPTQVTGLQVPPGSGLDDPIVVTSGSLTPITLADTFDYIVPGSPKADSGGGGCVAAAPAAGLAMFATPMLALLGLRRRRK